MISRHGSDHRLPCANQTDTHGTIDDHIEASSDVRIEGRRNQKIRHIQSKSSSELKLSESASTVLRSDQISPRRCRIESLSVEKTAGVEVASTSECVQAWCPLRRIDTTNHRRYYKWQERETRISVDDQPTDRLSG